MILNENEMLLRRGIEVMVGPINLNDPRFEAQRKRVQELIDKVLRRILNGESVAILGPPESGKTSLAWCVAQLSGLQFLPVNALVCKSAADLKDQIEKKK